MVIDLIKCGPLGVFLSRQWLEHTIPRVPKQIRGLEASVSRTSLLLIPEYKWITTDGRDFLGEWLLEVLLDVYIRLLQGELELGLREWSGLGINQMSKYFRSCQYPVDIICWRRFKYGWRLTSKWNSLNRFSLTCFCISFWNSDYFAVSIDCLGSTWSFLD